MQTFFNLCTCDVAVCIRLDILEGRLDLVLEGFLGSASFTEKFPPLVSTQAFDITKTRSRISHSFLSRSDEARSVGATFTDNPIFERLGFDLGRFFGGLDLSAHGCFSDLEDLSICQWLVTLEQLRSVLAQPQLQARDDARQQRAVFGFFEEAAKDFFYSVRSTPVVKCHSLPDSLKSFISGSATISRARPLIGSCSNVWVHHRLGAYRYITPERPMRDITKQAIKLFVAHDLTHADVSADFVQHQSAHLFG